MNLITKLILLIILMILPVQVNAGHRSQKETDALEHGAAYFFDLRNRESFIQVTNTDTESAVLHIQIWNVNDNCNENNFFDAFTPNDTHIYNMRDIQTNDGNPSGVVLPDDAYGAVVIYVTTPNDLTNPDQDREIIMGNMRILDDNGYEYRTNGVGLFDNFASANNNDLDYTFNFNQELGVTLSDVIHFRTKGSDDEGDNGRGFNLSAILDAWGLFEVNILDKDENVFSCRNVIFSCVNEDSIRLEELLEFVADNSDGASDASFEYGINEVLPNSRNAPLLCPGNTINEGVVTLELLNDRGAPLGYFYGLNNGNGRGSFDMWWQASRFNLFPVPPDG